MPSDRDHREPDHHHRAEEPARPARCRSAGSRRAPTSTATVIGTTSESEARRGDLQPLDRRQHRDRRRDHPVAVEERRAEHAERDQHELGPRRVSSAPCTSAIRARIPPSPSLSARMMKRTYSIETISVIDQKTSEIDAVDVRVRSSSPRGGRPRRPSAARTAGWCRCRRRRRRARRGPAPRDRFAPPTHLDPRWAWVRRGRAPRAPAQATRTFSLHRCQASDELCDGYRVSLHQNVVHRHM